VNADAIEESITSRLFTTKELRNKAKRRLASCIGMLVLSFRPSPSNEGQKIAAFTKRVENSATRICSDCRENFGMLFHLLQGKVVFRWARRFE
jgi:hypothetical protein